MLSDAQLHALIAGVLIGADTIARGHALYDAKTAATTNPNVFYLTIARDLTRAAHEQLAAASKIQSPPPPEVEIYAGTPAQRKRLNLSDSPGQGPAGSRASEFDDPKNWPGGEDDPYVK